MTSQATGGRARQSRARHTRHLILRAARRGIELHGFEKAKTQDIARQAGVAEGSVFAHFGNKQGLLIGLMEDHYAKLTAGVSEIEADHPDPTQRLGQLITFHLENLISSWQLVRVFAHYGRYADTPTARSFRQLNRAYTRAFADCLDDLRQAGQIDPEHPTDLLRDMIFGSAEHWAFRAMELEQRLDISKAVDFLMDRVLQPPNQAPLD